MNDKIKINLQMAGITYPATVVERKYEEMVREAAKQVNIRFSEKLKLYHDITPERAMILVAYQFALETLQLKQLHDTEPYISKIEEMTNLLDDYFKNIHKTD